jgi:hypothetical protein
MSKEKAPNEMSRAEIIKKLQGDGVDTIEKLVDRLLAFQAVPARSTVTPAKSALSRGDPTPEQLKNIHYTPPQVPLYIDGVSVEPAAISGFDGQILNFVIAKIPGGNDQTALHAFTGNDHVSFLKGAYADSLFSGSGLATRKESPHLLPLDPYSLEQVQVFQDINYQGNWTWFRASSYLLYPDLRNISRGCFLWWCGDWNDQISSMGATNTKVLYYWDINFSGPTLTVYPYIAIADLRIYGWNDAISSVWNLPNQ